MRGNRNTECFLQLIILFSISLFLIYLLVTGQINYYVHPRYHMGIWVCSVVLFVFAIKLVTELKYKRHNSNNRRYVIYFIPITFVLLFPVIGGGTADKVIAQSSSVTKKGNTVESIDGSAIETEQQIFSDDENIYSEKEITLDEPEDKSKKYPSEMINGAIRIEDEYFASWYYDLYDYLDDFKGKRYQFLAQVYSMEGLGDGEFLAGRYIMVCCASDLTGYGLICKSDMLSELDEDDWILVTATIDEYEYNGAKVPFLANPVIEKAQAPVDEYVYYNFY